MAVWKRDKEKVVVFYEEDPTTVNARDLVPFANIFDSLTTWEVGDSGRDGCLELSSPSRVHPAAGLADKSCPTLLLIDTLRRRGWVGEPRLVVHTNDTVGVYDDREPIRQKLYLVCLIAITSIMAINGVMKSNQRQNYYLRLLAEADRHTGLGRQEVQGALAAVGQEQ